MRQTNNVALRIASLRTAVEPERIVVARLADPAGTRSKTGATELPMKKLAESSSYTGERADDLFSPLISEKGSSSVPSCKYICRW